MKISSIWYSFKQGAKNIRRNPEFSLASIGTIVACLFLLGIFYIIVFNFSNAVTKIQSDVMITVFFDEGITGDQIEAIGEAIRVRDEINTMDFVSADEAWANFSKEKFADAQEDISSAFGTDNPLANCASYEITLNNLKDQDKFVDFLYTVEGVRKVNSSSTIANNLTSLNALVGYASGAIIFILLLVSIFLINNTITIGITVRKDEIAIMKLIGATNMFVRAPFMVEGVLIGLIGSVIPSVLLYFMYDAVTEYLIKKFPIIETLMTFASPGDIFSKLIPVILVIGVGIGLIGSIHTTRKHLKV